MIVKNLLLLQLIAITTSYGLFGQSPDLASAGDFAVFTATGAFNNSGATIVSGNVGTNAGAFSFSPGIVIGQTHVADNVSKKAATDLAAAYSSLLLRSCTSVLPVTLGNGQILEPNVYCLGEAATLTDTLILDGKGDPNALFIFKVNGALSTSSFSKVVLINSASFNNVYWQVTGRIDLGANSVFKGTIIGGGAIELLEGSSIVGRALTTAGAINLHNNKVDFSEEALPVTLTSFEATIMEGNTAQLLWATITEINSNRFEIEHSVNGKKWEKLSIMPARRESNNLINYEYVDQHPSRGVNLYRLKMVDTNETYTYSHVRVVNYKSWEKIAYFPNPVKDKLTLAIDAINQVQCIKIIDITGREIITIKKHESFNLSSEIDVSHLSPGMYVVQITSIGLPDVFLKILKQ